MSHTANIGHPRRQITDKTALLSSAAAQTLIAQSFPRTTIPGSYHACE
jgi:hypothetical protein